MSEVRYTEYTWWRCAEGHSWEAVIANRTGPIRAGCPMCARRKARRHSIEHMRELANRIKGLLCFMEGALNRPGYSETVCGSR